MLDIERLMEYMAYIQDCENIYSYTITNGTVALTDEVIEFFDSPRINLGVSLDGPKYLHNRYRNDSFDAVMENIMRFKRVTGYYPTFNATVGDETLNHSSDVIEFFRQFGTRITFSRMIGKRGIAFEDYQEFIKEAKKYLNVREGGIDCTMYGGLCGAGINNYFFNQSAVCFNLFFC